MSDTKHLKGRLMLIEREEGETLEDVCKRVYNNLGKTGLSPWNDNYQEQLLDDFYREYVVVNNQLYDVITKEEVNVNSEMFIVEEGDKEGEYLYEVKFYSGGCNLNEAIERGFENLT